jgi:hypothetical protein
MGRAASCSPSPSCTGLPTRCPQANKCSNTVANRLKIDLVRTRDEIDDELRLLAALRRSIREQRGEPSSRQVDELLDERGLSSGVQ